MSHLSQSVAVTVLNEAGPLLSGELAGAIGQHRKVNHDAARQLISRAAAQELIKSTFPVRFDRSLLYFLEKHQGRRLADAIRKSLPKKPSFDRVFKTMLANKGFITRGQIQKAAGCLPDTELMRPGGRMLVSDAVNQLTHLGLIKQTDADPLTFRRTFSS